MKSEAASKFLGAIAALALSAAVPAHAHGLFGKKKIEAPPPPPPIPAAAPAPPPVALSSHVIEAAGAYRAYMRKAAAISAAFQDGQTVESSLVSGAASEPQQLVRGEIAYAALLALQDPAFVAAVRTYAVAPNARDEITRRILADPRYVTAMPGAGTAAALIVTTLNADGARVSGTGALVKQSAYDIQHKKWSLAMVPDRDGRLARTKAASTAAMTVATAEETSELSKAVAGSDASGVRLVPAAAVQPIAPPYSPVVTRGLAIAALAALGQGGDDHDADVQTLLNDKSSGYCMNMSKLNLYQCLAVAKPYYEDVFCLGQHVLIDTGQCVSKDAGDLPAPVTAAAASVGAATAAGALAAH